MWNFCSIASATALGIAAPPPPMRRTLDRSYWSSLGLLMGITDEMMVSHLFKRLTLIESSFGDTDHHFERVSAALLAT